MKHLVTIVLLCVAGSAACARSADREVRGEEIPANLRDQPTNQPKQRFDRTGELLESKTKLEGLPLPVDLGPEVVLNGAHVYKSRLPIDKLVRVKETDLIRRVVGVVEHIHHYGLEDEP